MKQKKISKEEYIREFCLDRRIRDRKVIYVSTAVHDKLLRVVQLLFEEHITIASLADTILGQHIEAFRPLFNALEEETRQSVMAFPEKLRAEKSIEEKYDNEPEDEL